MQNDARSADHLPPGPEIAPVDARWQSLVEQYASQLRATLSRVSPDPQGPRMDDIELEARLKLCRALKSEPSDLFKTAARANIDAMRRARARREERRGSSAHSGRSQRWDAVEAPGSPQRRVARALARELVGERLAGLKGERRLALALHLRGLSVQEIGRLLRCPERRARMHVSSELEPLRSALHEWAPGTSWTDEELRLIVRETSDGIGGCPPAETLARAMSGTLPRDESQAVAGHLAECADCAEDAQGLRALESWAVRAELEGASPGRRSEEIAPRPWSSHPLLGLASALFVALRIPRP